MNRRDFTKKAVAASVAISVAPYINRGSFELSAGRTLQKGIYWGSLGVGHTVMEKFQAAKSAGFDGVEVMSHLNRDEVLAARDATGLKIPSLCGDLHWKFLLSDPDPAIRTQGAEGLKVAIEDAAIYGADTVLLVPGKVTESVTYDECWTRSVEEIKKVIPLAIEKKVKIAIENVWNNFLLSPMEAASYVDQFRTSFVGFYLDCGNVLAFGWPEQWIKVLSRRIAKVHIKEFSKKAASSQGNSAGFKVNLLEGDVSWSKVMAALDKIGYAGWTTIEQSGGSTPEGLNDLCGRLAKIQAS